MIGVGCRWATFAFLFPLLGADGLAFVNKGKSNKRIV